jgi:putative transcriptional regulator
MKNMIRTFRLDRGWTQQDLANRVGISRLMVNLFEHWRRDPSLPLAYRFADAFGKRIDEVFPHEAPTSLADAPKLSESEPQTASAPSAFPEHNRVRVSRVAKQWSQRELARRVGVATGTINAIERGLYKPSLALAYAISEELGDNVVTLFPLPAFRKLTPLGVHASGEINSNDGNQRAGRALVSEDDPGAGHREQAQGEAD